MLYGVCLTVPFSDHPVLLAEVLQPRDRERMGSSGIWVLYTSLEGGREAAGTWTPEPGGPGNRRGLTEERFSKCATTSFFQEPLAE